MDNTKLLRDIIRLAQEAGDAIRSNRLNEAEDLVNDVLVVAEMIRHCDLIAAANCVKTSFDGGSTLTVDKHLKSLIVSANGLLGQI